MPASKKLYTWTLVPSRSQNPTALSYCMSVATIIFGIISAPLAVWAAIIAMRRNKSAFNVGALFLSLVSVLYALVQLYFAYALSQVSF